MNSKTMNIVLMVIIALILVVTVVIAVMTFSNHTPQPLPMHNEENVEANVTVENTIKNEIVEQPENLSTLKNKGEIAKVRSVYTDENFKTVTVPAGYAIIKDSPNTNDGMVISDVADDDLDNSKEGNQFVWIPVETPVLDVSKLDNEIDINDAISESVSNKKYPMALKLADGNYKGVLYRFESINEDTATKVNFIAYSEGKNEREPANIDDNGASVAGWTQTSYQEEFNTLVKRVKNDGGFWVAK